MVIVRDFSEVLRQAGFTENHHVIEALPPNGADHALDVRTLPRRSWRSQQFLNSQLFPLLGEFGTEDAVAVAQQIARRAVSRKRLPQLLRAPFRGWMSGDAKMQNAPPLMRQHHEHVEHLEPDGRYRKEVDRNHGLHVVLQEGSPGLGGRVVAAHQVRAHTRLANVDGELEQRSVNPRSAPEWRFTVD